MTATRSADVVVIACHTGSILQADPLGAASVCASLPSFCQSEILNLPPDFDKEAVCAALSALQPRLIGFSLYVWNRIRLLELALELRKMLPDTVFVGGGPEVSGCIHTCHEFTRLFDVVIQGHAESMFRRLVDQVKHGTFERQSPIRVWRETHPELPVSPWLTGILEPGRGVLLETARGCPFRCAYCFDAGGSRSVVEIPHARLQEELKLFASSGVEQVWVLDSSFNVPASRGKALLRLFLAYAPQLHYHLEAKAEHIDSETAQLLTQLPCSVQVGLQSVHADVLKNVNRTLDQERFESGLSELYQHGVTYGIDLIYALPKDTYSGLRVSLDVALGFYPNHIEMFPLALLPGTALEQQRSVFGINAMDKPPYTVTSTSSMPPEEIRCAAVLAGALNLFYNTGRAVAYFDLLCSSINLSGVEFLEQLGTWLEQEGHISASAPIPDWGVEQAQRLQLEFITSYFTRIGFENLLPAVQDIIRYHYHYSETLLTAPVSKCLSANTGGEKNPVVWHFAPGTRIAEFSYPVEFYHNAAIDDLVEFVFLNPMEKCSAIFYRTVDNEVICTQLPHEVARRCVFSAESGWGISALEDAESGGVSAWIRDARGEGLLVQRPS